MSDLTVCDFWATRSAFFSAVKARCALCSEEVAVVCRELLGIGTIICPACFLRQVSECGIAAADPQTIEIAVGVAKELVRQHKQALAIAGN